MAPEADAAAEDAGSTPVPADDADATAEESTSEDTGEDASDDEPTGDPGDESETDDGSDDDAETGESVEASGDDDEDPEYRNLIRKFEHINDPKKRNAAIAKTFWEKTRYASKTRKENEELRLKLARLEGPEKPPKDEPPPPPPADLAKVTQRIEALLARNEQAETRRQEIVKQLNQADRELAIAEDRLKDVPEDDDRRPLAHQRVRQAKLELEAARDRYGRIIETLEGYNERMEQLLADKDWIEKFHSQQKERLTSEQKRNESFNSEFPQQVQALIGAAAKHLSLSIGDDERLSGSLWRHVNRALQADINGQYLETPLEDIPIPQMVLAYVKEWGEDRDLVKRKTFAKDSKDKLAVSRPGAGKPGGGKAPGAAPKPPAPPSSRPAVSPALLSPGMSPAMAKARKALVERFG